MGLVLICLIVIAALAACVISAWRRAGAAPSPAARPAERRPAEVIEEGFSSESIAYGRSVMDHSMLEREAAKLCEKIKTEIRNKFETGNCTGGVVWYEIHGYDNYMTYVQDYVSDPANEERTLISYYTDRFPSEGKPGRLKGQDQILGTVWAFQHLTLARLRREVPQITFTRGRAEMNWQGDVVECVLCIQFKK